MNRWIRTFTPALTLGLFLTASQASSQILFTSFEATDWPLGSTDFRLGSLPASVHYTGGLTASTLNPFAYRTGVAAWGVFAAGQVATADFDTVPAAAVSFFSVNVGGASGVIDVFDQNDVNVGTFAVTQTDMMNNASLFSFTAAQFGVTGLGKITMTNSGGAGHQVWIDDMTTTIPEPATLLVVSGGLALLAARRRKRTLVN